VIPYSGRVPAHERTEQLDKCRGPHEDKGPNPRKAKACLNVFKGRNGVKRSGRKLAN